MTKEEAHKILCRNILPCLIGEWREAISIATKALEAEPNWIPVTKEEMFKAGYEGREIRFRVDGRLFAIRELAQ